MCSTTNPNPNSNHQASFVSPPIIEANSVQYRLHNTSMHHISNPNLNSQASLSEGGIGVGSFGPFLPWFFGVLDFKAWFCSLLQHHGLRLLALIVGSLGFADVVNGFSVAL